MSDCEATAFIKECTQGTVSLTCNLWYGHWPGSPHLDRELGIHWFRTQDIPVPEELQREQPGNA